MTLWDDSETFEKDAYGRTLAVVKEAGGSLQEELLAAGWVVYCRRPAAAPEPYRTLFLAAMKKAKQAFVFAKRGFTVPAPMIQGNYALR